MIRFHESWPLACRRACTPAPTLSALAGLIVSMTAPQAAAESSPYYVAMSESVSHESNLLRLSDGQAVSAPYAKSDTTFMTALQAGLDQSIGRQRVGANLSLRDVRYRGNSLFNNQGYTGGISLDWSTAQRISGRLSASANRSLSGFNGYEVGLLNAKNFETTRGYSAGVNIGVVTQYSLELNAGHRSVSNSLDNVVLQARNFKQDNGSLVLRWRPSGVSSLGLGVSQSVGRFPKFGTLNGTNVSDRYKQGGVDLLGNFSPSGLSQFDLRISRASTRYDLNAARDFSGVTGSLGWQWRPSGKLQLNTRLSRDTGQDSYAVTVFSNVPGSSDSSRIVNTLRLDGTWAVTGKVSLTASLQQVERSVVQTVNNPLLPLNASGKDSTTSWSLATRWSPYRTVNLGCEVSQENRRASGQLTTNMHAQTVSCFGQLLLQP